MIHPMSGLYRSLDAEIYLFFSLTAEPQEH
jgi:hypothetical protein